MSFQVDTSKGYTEAIFNDDCEFSEFEKIASILKTKLNIVFTKQLDDFDSFWWDFIYNNSTLCLHYNNYMGVSIFPEQYKNATETDNGNVIKIAKSFSR